VARKIAKAFTTRMPDLADFKGRPLRAFLEELMRWLGQFARAQGEPGAMEDRRIAVTSGTITACTGTSGTLGAGDVILRKINDSAGLDAKDTIAVKSIMLTTIATGKLVIVERIEGVMVITAVVC
jgi:hypothetical protein